MINIKWLKTFSVLTELGSFTKTAELLYMTQPGVSQHINKLEDLLQQKLLIRKGKHFTLTDTGTRLRLEAQDILKRLSDIEAVVSRDSAYEGEVRIMSPGSVGLTLYPQLLTLQSQHPKLIVDYRFAPNDDIEKAVLNNKIDLGFMNKLPTSNNLISQEISQEALLLVTPATVEHISWQQLNSLGFIDHPDGAHHANLLLGANYPEFQHVDKLPKKGFSNQVSQILKPVSLGLGFTVLPTYAVAAFAEQHLIKIHPLTHAISEPVFTVELKDKPRPKRVSTIINAAASQLTAEIFPPVNLPRA